MQLHVFKDAPALTTAVADWIIAHIRSTLQAKGRYSIALSGGSTPQRLYALLAQSPYREQVDWAGLHVFWGDERAVPFADERNNAKMAFDHLLNHVPIPREQIHVMRTDLESESSAWEYNRLLHRFFQHGEFTFDLVLLGMGDDGHTLSLFPGTEILHETVEWTKAYYLEPQKMFRISLTAPVVNKAAAIVFLATGDNKAEVLRQVLEGPFLPEKYPSQLIRPEKGEVHWFVDEAAASALTRQ